MRIDGGEHAHHQPATIPPPELVRSVLDCAPDAMIIVDASGAIRFANRQVTALFGYEPGELTGESVERLLPGRFRAPHVAHRERYSTTPGVRPMGSGLDLFAQRKDGTEFPVEISLSPARDGADMLIVAAIRDFTERRRIQTELREARATAERANRTMNRFLATASHDLRQPLQALTFLNGTMRRLAGQGDLAEVVLQAEQVIGAMSRLLDALLGISKLESGAIQPQPTDFKVVVDSRAVRRHILLVEDEPGVRNATRMLLKVEGYDVSTAASRGEALEQAASHRDLALLITDFHLSAGETGIQVISAVRTALQRELGVIVMTGDTSSAMQHLRSDSRLRIANKPVRAEQLLALIQELLVA